MECGGEGIAQDGFLVVGLGDRDGMMRSSSWGAQKEQVAGARSRLGHVGGEDLVGHAGGWADLAHWEEKLDMGHAFGSYVNKTSQ